MISSRSGDEAQVLQAKQLLADTLSPLLVPGNPKGVGGRAIQGLQGAHQSPPGLPRSNLVPQHHSIQDAQLNPHSDEVPIDDQVYTKLELTVGLQNQYI